MKRLNVAAYALFAVIFSTSAYAITYIVPTDRELVQRADAIVTATAIESHSEFTADGAIVTIASLSVEDVLKGNLNSREPLRLVEMGGQVDGHAMLVPGSPRYENGARYLVFLRHDRNGNWATWGFELGQFRFQDRYLVRLGRTEGVAGYEESDWSPHIEHLRDAEGFLAFVRLSARSGFVPAMDDYFVDQTGAPLRTPVHVHELSAGGARRIAADGLTIVGLDGLAALSAAASNWTGVGVGVHYSVGSLNPAATKGIFGGVDNHNAVLFNSSNIPAGVAALGAITAEGATYTFQSVSYADVHEVDIEIGTGFSAGIGQALFNALVTHEMGHTLGLRHSDGTSNPNSPNTAPGCVLGTVSPPCTNDAIMNHLVSQTSLRPYDTNAVTAVYGAGGTPNDYLWSGGPPARWANPTASFDYCSLPYITGQPQASPSTISSGNSSQLSVTSIGVDPLAYQWYVGSTPDTSSPVNGGTSASIMVSPSSTTTYWARVTNACGTVANGLKADSNPVTVTVQGCTPASVQTQPQASPTSINSGNSSQLTVVGAGSATLSYQWYVGSPSNTSSPVPASNSNSISVSPASTTTYWVRISNGCGSADSQGVTVTVGSCTSASVQTQPQATPSTINSGNSSQLTVVGAGSATLSYQWYVGSPSNTSSPVPASNSNSISVSPASTTTYWVRISNGCGSADSQAVTVTVSGSQCTPPSFNQQALASPNQITTGNSSQLSVVGAGTPVLSYQWYIGSTGNTSSPVPNGGSSIINVSPTVTTTYWARVSNGCGSADSASATVTVGGGCAPPTVIRQPDDQTVTPGVVNLFVGFGGTTPTVVWYQGAAPDTSHSVGVGQSLQITVTSTTQFWAQLTNGCGSANTQTATITVTNVCTAPGVTSAGANPSSVAPSGPSVLTVVATGTSLTYQWYRGNAGDTSNPIASATATTLNVAPATTTSYWVRVTNGCGTADSNTVTVTVTTSCTPPTVTTQPLSTTLVAGQKDTLSVIASGASLTYQWYQGAVDDTSKPIGTNDSSITVQPFTTTSYWVKVTNSCGNAKSSAAVITVNPYKRRAAHH